MNRRDFLKVIGLGGATTVLPGFMSGTKLSVGEASCDRPNIILIMADDLGFSDIGCYGSEVYTPNLDRLAAEGVRFTQFYNVARCCPTRASLLTGLYPHQVGMGGMVNHAGDIRPPGPYQGYLNDKCVTIAEVLKDAGYHTLMSGKWHVGESRPHWPTDRGFEKYFGLISGAANYFDITKGKAKDRKRQMAIDDKPYLPPKDNFYMTDAITEHAVNFIDQSSCDDKPFFLYVAYTAPHWPLHALPEDIAKYKGKYLMGWDVLRKQRYARQVEMGIIDKRWPLTPRDETAIPWNEVKDKELMDLKMAVYAAQIDRMDQGVGKLLAKLKEIGKEENTLILFLSDNGGCAETGPLGFDSRNNGLPPGGVDSYMSYGCSWANASNTPFRLFKKWVHEGGISTPFIAYWPCVIKDKGSINNHVCHVIDIMATCVDLAGTKYPNTFNNRKILPIEGKSLLPIFEGKQRTGHSYLYWEHMKHEAVRHDKWKLVARKPGRWELYDLELDRSEMNNLSDKYPEIAQQLKSKYQEWAIRWGVRR
ncbi:MAG: sulfatase-like hydrolase/transferase [Planctomycetota bacterium]|jgi:arylsulfatase